MMMMIFCFELDVPRGLYSNPQLVITHPDRKGFLVLHLRGLLLLPNQNGLSANLTWISQQQD